MKKYFAALFALVLLASCSKNDIAYTSEWDDMYFSSEDREKLTASTKEFYDQNFTEDYEVLTAEEAVDYSDINYSSKTVNPEYIAKYTSDVINDDDLTSADYYDKDYEDSVQQARQFLDAYSGMNSNVSTQIYQTYAWGPFGGYPRNRYYNGFAYYGFYDGWRDPFGHPYAYSTYRGYPMYHPYYGYEPFYRPYYGGSATYYCPSTFTGYATQSTVIVNNGKVDQPVVSVRQRTTGPRSSRGMVADRSGSDFRDGTGNGPVYYPDGTIEAQTSGRNSTKTTQNNYYRRTSSRQTSNANTRTSQSSRSYNNSGAYTRSKANGTASNYSRSTSSSSQRGGFLKQFTSGSSTTNRSTNSSSYSTQRSSSQGRSTRTSGYSSPSRSSYSSSPTRSTSSGASRGTSSGRSSGSRRGN